MVGFSDLELDNKLSLSSLTPQELYFFGIARALWCKPKYIAICEPNENGNTTVDDLISRIITFCINHQIGLIYLSTRQSSAKFNSFIEFKKNLLSN